MKNTLATMDAEQRQIWFKGEKEKQLREGRSQKRTFDEAKASIGHTRSEGQHKAEQDQFITFNIFALEKCILKEAANKREAWELWKLELENPTNTVIKNRGEYLLHRFGGVHVNAYLDEHCDKTLKQSQVLENAEDMDKFEEAAADMFAKRQRLRDRSYEASSTPAEERESPLTSEDVLACEIDTNLQPRGTGNVLSKNILEDQAKRRELQAKSEEAVAAALANREAKKLEAPKPKKAQPVSVLKINLQLAIQQKSTTLETLTTTTNEKGTTVKKLIDEAIEAVNSQEPEERSQEEADDLFQKFEEKHAEVTKKSSALKSEWQEALRESNFTAESAATLTSKITEDTKKFTHSELVKEMKTTLKGS